MNFLQHIVVLSLLISSITLAKPANNSVITDIYYAGDATINNPRRLDVYKAFSKNTKTPVLIWFHGGGLTSGTKNHETDKKFAAFWQSQGITVINADYRLNPEVMFPTYIEDAASAVAWAVNNANRYNIDATKIFVGGHSAGAYLTTMLALAPQFLTKNNINPHQLAGYISLSGQMTTHFTVRKERGLSDWPVVVDDAAPSFYVSPTPPAILFLIGDDDWPARLEENQLIQAQFSKLAKTDKTAFHIIPNRNHSSIYEKIIEPKDPTFQLIEEFMKKSKALSN